MQSVRGSLLLAGALLLQACASLPGELEREIRAGNAVEGEVHGAYPELGLYVFTYRAPENFFDFVEVSLVPSTETLAGQLADLHRHDRVRIRGPLMDTPSPQPHVEISGLEIVSRYQPEIEMPAYAYRTNIPEDLRGKDNELFLVHPVHAGGSILLLEHRDVVLPL